jgi:biopolymer transport protein ExbB
MLLESLESWLRLLSQWLPPEGLRLLEHGGKVLPFIGLFSGLMWLLIAERYWFLLITHRRRLPALLAQSEACASKASLPCRWLRAGQLSECGLSLRRGLGLIEALTQSLPLLGLLGTVEGMIELFHALALHGSGNVRAMAGGISVALFSTLAGLVTALSGLYFSADLRERVEREILRVRDLMI